MQPDKSSKKGDTPYLDAYSEDLTSMAKKGLLDPVIGREREVSRICQVLSRRKKNNPIILGDPGVGKTAIIEAVAQRISDGKIARTMKNKRLVSLNVSSLVAGTKYRGEFEERMKKLVDELKANPNVIVFIDEIHTIVGAGGAGGSLDASNILKPALARGQVHCIGATTLDEYREHIEVDGALTRRFQEVLVNEPTLLETIQVLNKIKHKYESHHNVLYSDEAIEACVRMSERYITSRKLPDKAIDLMDETGSIINLDNAEVPSTIKKMELDIEDLGNEKNIAVKTHNYERAGEIRDQVNRKKIELDGLIRKWEEDLKKNPKPVTPDDVASAISSQTGIPVNRLCGSELTIVKNLAEELKKQVIGQDLAVDALSKVIKRSRTGVNSHKKPIGSFLFMGPTGVGKTEMVKALTEYMFGDEDALIRVDMSEYQEKFSVSRLTGAPPGYVGHEDGGQLTESIRRRPYSVILFDEIEKAHPDIFNILLQVLDDGRLTDSLGRVVDFTNTIIILTSNIGAKKASEFGPGIGLTNKQDRENEKNRIESTMRKELKSKFSPEFINRLDDIIVFEHLSETDMLSIVDIELKDVVDRMAEQNMRISFTKNAKEFLAKEGYDREYGARPLKRAIQRYVEDLLADAILEETLTEGKDMHVISYMTGETRLTLK